MGASKKRNAPSKSKQVAAKKQATETATEDKQPEEGAEEETETKEDEESEEKHTSGAKDKDSKKPAVGATGKARGTSGGIDIIFAFDATGSMYPCLGEVRRNVAELVSRLFRELKELRVGITAFGDIDAGATYDIKHQPLSADEAAIIDFVTTVPVSGSWTAEECYELALHEARSQPWRSDAIKTLVIIGDTYPNEKNANPKKLDWQEEAKALKAEGVTIYGVQCLFNGIRTSPNYRFFEGVSRLTNGYHLFLDQFAYVRDMILAVCFKQMDDDNHRLAQYEQEIAKSSGLSKSMKRLFDTMLGREVEEVASYEGYDPEKVGGALCPCPPAKYQVLQVDEDMPIKEFVQKKSLQFKTGKGFYEFTKAEQISAKKLIVLMHKTTGELFEGAAARQIAGIGDTAAGKKLAPSDVKEYRVFVQSTSYNRKLQGGTGFLYESE